MVVLRGLCMYVCVCIYTYIYRDVIHVCVCIYIYIYI